MTEVVYQFGGVVDKFVGDEIMVLFGAPLQEVDHAERALRCGLEMIKRRKDMNQQAAIPIFIGIGIAQGEMVAGCMGSIDRLNYTVIGERVNLAARLCSKAGKMEIVVDDTIFDLHSDLIPGAEKTVSSVKGFESDPTYYLLKNKNV
jgi:class 3 adenylate cyclase